MTEAAEHYERHIIQDEVLHTVMAPERLYVVHAPEPDYSFMYGSAFNEDGEIEAQQFERDENRIQLFHEEDEIEVV